MQGGIGGGSPGRTSPGSPGRTSPACFFGSAGADGGGGGASSCVLPNLETPPSLPAHVIDYVFRMERLVLTHDVVVGASAMPRDADAAMQSDDSEGEMDGDDASGSGSSPQSCRGKLAHRFSGFTGVRSGDGSVDDDTGRAGGTEGTTTDAGGDIAAGAGRVRRGSVDGEAGAGRARRGSAAGPGLAAAGRTAAQDAEAAERAANNATLKIMKSDAMTVAPNQRSGGLWNSEMECDDPSDDGMRLLLLGVDAFSTDPAVDRRAAGALRDFMASYRPPEAARLSSEFAKMRAGFAHDKKDNLASRLLLGSLIDQVRKRDSTAERGGARRRWEVL